MQDEITGAPAEGVSRRDVLRRSALVGGTMVWMAPAVQTLATPAFANGTGVPGDGCACVFFLKYDPEDGTYNGFDNAEGNGNLPSCDPNGSDPAQTPGLSAYGNNGVTIVACGRTIGHAFATYDEANGGCVTITFDFAVSPDSSYFLVKDGGGNGCEPSDGGDFGDAAVGGSFKFCGDTSPQQELSHVNMAVCVAPQQDD